MPVINMGITGNSLACLVLIYFGTTGGWSSWGTGAQVFMSLSATGALGITLSLLKFRRRFSMRTAR